MPGPPIFGFSRPLTTSMESRMASPSNRRRLKRHSSLLSGSILAASSLTCRRLLVGVGKHDPRCSFLMLQPFSTKLAAR